MNYSSIYCALITKRLQNPIEKGSGIFVEKHHIIPKSEGGDNSSDNLVNLTAREHYIAHLLLYKIYKDKKMWCALNMLAHGHCRKKMSDAKPKKPVAQYTKDGVLVAIYDSGSEAIKKNRYKSYTTLL